MRRTYWLAMILALVSLIFVAPTALATTYNTITVDGDLSEWAADEYMETGNGGDFYVTWDAASVYFGLANVNVDDNGVFFIYIDAIPGQGTLTGFNWNGTHTLPFAADFAIAADSGFNLGWLVWNNGTMAWDWTPYPGANYVGWSGNPNSEFQIFWTEMVSPDRIYVMALFQNQGDNGVTASWPTPNPANNSGSEIFTHHYHFPSLVAGQSPHDSVLADHVVINEFKAKDTEHIEIYNPTDAAVDLTGWELTDGEGSNGLTGVIAPGAYLDVATSLDLSNIGDEIELISGTTTIDMLAYGTNGGAPIEVSNSVGLGSFSIQRVPNGTDTDDDARDFNMSQLGQGTTFGAANTAFETLLGSSLVINEVNAYQDAGDEVSYDYYELYNPLAHTVIITDWYVTDGGDGVQMISGTIPAGDWLVYSDTLSISSGDPLYLWNDLGIRVDQITADAPGDEFGTLQRICDGNGPNDGYDWPSSGGDVTLLELPSTHGTTNTPGPVDMEVTKDAPSSIAPGALMTYTVTYQGLSPAPAAAYALTDTLPAEVIYVASDPAGVYDPVAHELYWSGTAACGFPSGSFEITVQVTDTVQAGDKIVNMVWISATGDLTPTNDYAVVTTTVTALNVTVAKTGPDDPLWPGDTVTYTISYMLDGNEDARDVVITDTFPADFIYVAHNIYPPMTCTPTMASLVCATPTLTQAGWIILTGTVASSPSGYVLTNTVVITASNDGDPLDNQDEYVNHLFVPIHEIQYVPDPVGDDTSPYAGQYAWVEGVVIAASDVFGTVNTRYYIEDPAGGPWSGLLIYNGGNKPPVAEGDWVLLYGLVKEYSGVTELDITDGVGGSQTVASTGNDLPPPEVLATGTFTPTGAATAEAYESVLIEFQGATVTDEDLGYGEWAFDDGSGEAHADAWSNLMTYVPALGDFYNFIRGIGNYSYSEYKLVPRYDADVDLDYQVTFIYHDLEDVAYDGEDVYIAGSFNGWDPNATALNADAGYSVFSVTLTLPTTGTHEYKYIVKSGGDQWDWLNTGNRTVDVDAPMTVDDYRHVSVGYALLSEPLTITILLGETTPDISGEVYIQNVTNPDGVGRGVLSELGYGMEDDPALWDWAAMTYSGQNGNNDVLTATITPVATGVYSYAVRFDGNWGAGNPNTGWTYGDLDGVYPGEPFELENAGVLTVLAPDLTIQKMVAPKEDIGLGSVVTYTIVLSNSGDADALGVVMTDVLPLEMDFGGWVQQNGAIEANDTLTWTGDISVGVQLTFVFTATVGMDPAFYGQPVTNTAYFVSDNAGSGSDGTGFAIVPAPEKYYLYLPIMVRND